MSWGRLRRRKDAAHNLGSCSGSAFTGRLPPAAAAQRQSSGGAQLCSAVAAPGTLPVATLVGPARETQTAAPPQQQARLRLEDRVQR